MSDDHADPTNGPPADDDSAATSTLRLHRPALGHAGLRQVQVLVDGQVAALLGEGDTIDHRVHPGVHQLWAHLDWATGQHSSITVAGDQVVELHVVPDGPALSPLRHDVVSTSYRLTAAPGSQPVLEAPSVMAPPPRRSTVTTGVLACLAVVALVLVLLLAARPFS